MLGVCVSRSFSIRRLVGVLVYVWGRMSPPPQTTTLIPPPTPPSQQHRPTAAWAARSGSTTSGRRARHQISRCVAVVWFVCCMGPSRWQSFLCRTAHRHRSFTSHRPHHHQTPHPARASAKTKQQNNPPPPDIQKNRCSTTRSGTRGTTGTTPTRRTPSRGTYFVCGLIWEHGMTILGSVCVFVGLNLDACACVPSTRLPSHTTTTARTIKQTKRRRNAWMDIRPDEKGAQWFIRQKTKEAQVNHD